MPTLEQIAKTICGPNERRFVGDDKLRELQDIKWGRLKAQDQAHLLRAAKYVQDLFDQVQGGEQRAPHAVPPPLPVNDAGGVVTPPHPATLPVCQLSDNDLLRLFRQFVSLNVTQWKLGAGDHHHPMWSTLAEAIESEENTFGPDWAFIQPENRKMHSVLLAEYIDMMNEREATERGG